jgi:XTP/dITP diphosphohydrolase
MLQSTITMKKNYMELVLATSNMHKIREFKEMLKTRSLKHIDLLSLHQFPTYAPPEETGLSFRENAILKAEHAAKSLNRWAIADDSGLVVPALKGEPGIYSKRYAGLQSTDAENRKKLLANMQHLRGLERAAYYECCLVLAAPEGVKKCVSGICEGCIALEEKGRHGFGYDPLFIKNDYDKTFSEIGDSVKNRVSHRSKAFERLAAFLETLRD